MKTIYTIVGILLTMFITGCQDEEYSKRRTSAVKVFASAPSTRVNYTEDGDRTLVTWKDGDKILLFTDEQWVYYTASVQKDGTTDVEFLPSGDFLQNSEGKAVYALYSSADKYSIEEKKVSFGWGAVGNIDRQKEPYLYAVDTIRDGKLNLHFHHVLSYLKVNITKDMLPVSVTNGKLNRVTIVADGFAIGASQVEFDLDRREITDITRGDFSVVRSLEEHDFTVSDFECYMPIIPCLEVGSINVSLHKDNTTASYYTLEKKVPEGGFLAGHVYKLTLDDYYEYFPGGIYSLQDLLAFRDATLKYESLDPWRDSDGVINIFSDIDISSIKDWGMDDNHGNIIDGNGHTILVDIINEYGCSFMGTNEGVIRNLTITGKMTVPYSSMIIPGNTCGFCRTNDGVIYNCHSNITFVVQNEASIGGLCGTNMGTIEACTNRSLISSGLNAGGIALSLDGGSIINCQNYGEAKVIKDASHIFAGGIVGSLNGGTLVGCSNEGKITATTEQGKLGGICGFALAGTLDNNVNKGTVQGGYTTGGIVGDTYGYSEKDSVLVVSNCSNKGAISSEVSGGICGIANLGVILKKNSNVGTVNGVSPTAENSFEIGLDNRESKNTK